jgi:hypothetical protein
MWKKAVWAYLNVQHQNFPVKTEGAREKYVEILNSRQIFFQQNVCSHKYLSVTEDVKSRTRKYTALVISSSVRLTKYSHCYVSLITFT